MVLEQTDQELVEACRRGEREAFRALFERHKDKVYSIALRYSGDESAAMDIAQDVFLKLFSCIASFRGDAGFDSWLFRLVVNRCLDQRRRMRRLLPLMDGLLEALRAPGRSAIEEVLRSEMSSRVRSAVTRLPPEQRMVIVLRYTQGLSYDEIAQALGGMLERNCGFEAQPRAPGARTASGSARRNRGRELCLTQGGSKGN